MTYRVGDRVLVGEAMPFRAKVVKIEEMVEGSHYYYVDWENASSLMQRNVGPYFDWMMQPLPVVDQLAEVVKP